MKSYQSLLNIIPFIILTSSLIGCGGSEGAEEETKIEKVNRAPNVSISGVQSIIEGQTVDLGAQANDPDGDIIMEYSWSLPSDYNITFTQGNNEISFIAPDVAEDTELNINLTVIDTLGTSANTSYQIIISNTPSHLVAATSSANGSITPSSISIEEGQAYTFSISPQVNYEIDSISGCKGELNGDTYTTSLISEACQIHVSFLLIPLSKQANIENVELAECIDSTDYTSINEVIDLVCWSLTDIHELDAFVNLKTLRLNSAQLSGDIVVPYLPSLTSLHLSRNIREADVIDSLDISQNTALSYIYISGVKIPSIDVSALIELEELTFDYSELEELDVSNLLKLRVFRAFNNKLKNIDVSNNLALTDLYLASNNLKAIDISQNLKLLSLYVGSNEIDTIDLSKHVELITFSYDNNGIANIDLSNNLKLKNIDLSSNNLTEIDLSIFPDLERAYLDRNKLVTLDFSSNSQLVLVWASNNRLVSVAGIEEISYKAVYISMGENFPLSADSISYLRNLKDNLGYSGIQPFWLFE